MPNTQILREVVIHESANRPNQLLGGDRELVLVALLVAVSLAFALATWWGIALSTVLWVTAVAVLKRMGKADPQLRQVYLRHIRYGLSIRRKVAFTHTVCQRPHVGAKQVRTGAHEPR